MNRQSYVRVVALFVAVALLSGCHSDPNMRKQKYLASGERYSAQGKYREAAIQFENSLKADKNFPDAHYALAQAYVHLGKLGPAYGELARTVDLQPTNYKARIDLGSLSLAAGKTADAQAQANAVLKAEPNNPDVHALLSAIALRRGQKDQSLIEMRRALALAPNRAVYYEDLALLQSDDPTQLSSVENNLKKAIALDPKSVNARLSLASLYAKTNRWPEAEQVSQDAIATDPKSITARAALAQIFLKEGNQPKAEDVLRKASQDLAEDPQGVSMLADYYAASGQMEKAKAEFSRLAAKHPKNVLLQEDYIRVLLQTKDYVTAKATVAALMKTNSSNPGVTALDGIVLLNQGDPNDAVNALLDGAKNFPQDAFIQYWLGKAALAKGDSALAEKSFRQAVALKPNALEALQNLAQIAVQHGDMNLLADVAGKTIAAAPRLPEGYVWRATTEMSQNSPQKAEADLKTAIDVSPQSPSAYIQLAKLQFAQKRFSEGLSSLEQALRYDPNSAEALRLEIGYYLYNKQPEKALARLNAQIEKSPANSGFYDLLAQLQMRDKEVDQAASSAQKAMQLNPADRDAAMLFAQAEVQRGQAANAVATWKQWSDAHPKDAGAIAVLGMLEQSSGNRQIAETDYKRSLQIQPQQPVVANNLAYLMLQNGEDVDVALTLAQTARQGMPNSPNSADTLAWAYYYKGTYEFARDLLEDAIKADPDNATMQYHLGMVYSKLRDKNNAAIHLKKAMSLGAGSPTAKEAQAALQQLT
ncbi:MAG TPA: tetratricopeptide repeat protein [Acidobacteriaceae bacterium]|nr:tetratricopeptide repeat protein [Acidobacteriaceae bacterium]